MTRRRLGIRILPRRATQASDSGFLLLETVIATTIITIVMAGVTTLLIATTHSTTRQRSAQAAAQLAVSALDQAQALGATDALLGRDQAAVDAQFASRLATDSAVAPWLATMTPAYAPAGSTGTGLPTSPVEQEVNGATYGVNYFVGDCWRAAGGAGDCTTSGQGVPYVRVVAVVSWTASGCPAAGCTYVSAILLNGGTDSSLAASVTAAASPTSTSRSASPSSSPSATKATTTSPAATSSSPSKPPCVLYSNQNTTSWPIPTSTSDPRTSSYPVHYVFYDGVNPLGGSWVAVPQISSSCATNGPLTYKSAVLSYSTTGDSVAVETVQPGVACRTGGTNAACLTTDGQVAIFNPFQPSVYCATVTVADSAGKTSTYSFSWKFGGSGLVPPSKPPAPCTS